MNTDNSEPVIINNQQIEEVEDFTYPVENASHDIKESQS